MQSLAELRAREQEVEREWQWLHDTLNEIARVRAEQGDVQAFRLMQHQAMRVGQRRVELRLQMAELERPASQPPWSTARANLRAPALTADGRTRSRSRRHSCRGANT